MLLFVIDDVMLYGMCSVFVGLASGLLCGVVWRVLFVCCSCVWACFVQMSVCALCVSLGAMLHGLLFVS